MEEEASFVCKVTNDNVTAVASTGQASLSTVFSVHLCNLAEIMRRCECEHGCSVGFHSFIVISESGRGGVLVSQLKSD